MPYSIFVVNIRTVSDAEYCGRPSPLQNPNPIGLGASRDKVCDDYEVSFQQAIRANDPLIMSELRRLHRLGKARGTLKLGCFCAPKHRCHVETIKRWLEDNYDYLEMLEETLC